MSRARAKAAPAWTLVMSVAASSLSFIEGSVLNVALPAIRISLDASAAEVQWVVNAYTLPLAALILLGGALGDHQGRRLWLIIGTALFAIPRIACPGAPEELLEDSPAHPAVAEDFTEDVERIVEPAGAWAEAA